MKATGIVRRIDDLGRVVIPKEIRRTLRIREGDPLEIFTSNDGEVIDIIDLCIHPVKGLKLLQECKKNFKCIVIQPGASDEALLSYLNENNMPYIDGCLLVGLKLYTE